jgi:hypothetical protein
MIDDTGAKQMLVGGYRILPTSAGIQCPLFQNPGLSTAEHAKKNGLTGTALSVADQPVLRGDHCLS